MSLTQNDFVVIDYNLWIEARERTLYWSNPTAMVT